MVSAFRRKPRRPAGLSMARLFSAQRRRTAGRREVHSAVPAWRMGARTGFEAESLVASRPRGGPVVSPRAGAFHRGGARPQRDARTLSGPRSDSAAVELLDRWNLSPPAQTGRAGGLRDGAADGGGSGHTVLSGAPRRRSLMPAALQLLSYPLLR